MGRAMSFAQLRKVRKQRPPPGQFFQHGGKVVAEMQDARLRGFQTLEADNAGGPVNVRGGEQGDVGLAGAQVPRDFVEDPSFGVWVGSDDFFVLAPGDRSPLAKPHLRPLAARDDRSWQPIEVEREVLNLAQVQVRRDRAGLEHRQEMLRVGFDDDTGSNVIEGGMFDGAQPAGLGGIVLGFDERINGVLPGAFAQTVITRGKEGLRHLQIHGWLAHGLILRQDKLGRFAGVFRAEAFPPAGVRIETIKRAAAQATLDGSEPIFHGS